MDTQSSGPATSSTTAPLDAGTLLSELAQRPTVRLALAAMRESLGMEFAYCTKIDGTQMTVIALDGDGASFHVAEGLTLPVEETYCGRVLNGRLPNLVGDVRGEDRAAALPMTELRGVGAFASMPLRFSDGRIFGTLCAVSHGPRPALGYRHLQTLHVVARLAADVLEREALQGPDGSSDSDLLTLTNHLRSEALDVLETAGAKASRSGTAGVVDGLQEVANQLGSVERMLLPAD